VDADQFWDATPHEAWACIEAREEANKRCGGDRKGG
jgi:hypothetical protein